MKKNRTKKLILVLALCATVGLGGTLAYLTSVSNKTNTFTSDGTNVNGSVKEDSWSETDDSRSQNYRPGDVIAKDPRVEFTADSEAAYAGMQLTFLDSEENKLNYADFSKLASHDGITTGWELIATNGEGSELYMYTGTLIENAETKVKTTPTIFNSITVNAGITTVTDITDVTHYVRTTTTDAEGKVTSSYTTSTTENKVGVTYYDAKGQVIGEGTDTNATKLPTFKIDVTGLAIQTANVDIDTAKTQLIALANADATEKTPAYFVAK